MINQTKQLLKFELNLIQFIKYDLYSLIYYKLIFSLIDIKFLINIINNKYISNIKTRRVTNKMGKGLRLVEQDEDFEWKMFVMIIMRLEMLGSFLTITERPTFEI